LQVWDRGWLSSTGVLVLAAPGEAGALLFDSGHSQHAEMGLALVERGLAGRPLRAVFNTHLHSDHCGGNALLQTQLGAQVWVPEGQAEAVREWDEPALSHHATGQLLQRFSVDRSWRAGESLVAGGREWQLLSAPGHDPHALMPWDARHGVLVAGDVLWEQGVGVIFPELLGESGFEEAHGALDLIAALPVRCLVPGHGSPFADVRSALQRARQRLQRWQADPLSHARYASKVLIKYHLMEHRRELLTQTLAWATQAPLLMAWWDLQSPRPAASLQAWASACLDDLLAQGALRRDGEWLFDTG
jgi:glyoxylase-like metal-dependent hydrolase (beta-lactamase superfamily II)